MSEDSLQERLRHHSKAFDGLLSLIPAKVYYPAEPSGQWKKKKQSKAKAAEARRKKLDPESGLNRSVKEVMDEQASKKRKLDLGEDDQDSWSEFSGVSPETPGQCVKKQKKQKKQKLVPDEPEPTEEERRKVEKKAARKVRKAERKKLREEEAAYEKRNVKSGVNKVKLGPRHSESSTNQSSINPSDDPVKSSELAQSSESFDDEDEAKSSDLQELDDSVLANEDDGKSEATSTPLSHPHSPLFEPNGTPADSTGQAPSTATSYESTDAPPAPSDKPRHIKIPKDSEELRARLAAKIQALRAARKADGPDGQPIRTREQLIESRRRKQAERKAQRQEQRQRDKEEEERKREKALASARNSPAGIFSPTMDLVETNFTFGRVAFGDGAQLSRDLSHVLAGHKKKGASDPKTALIKFSNQKKRIEGMDEDKRKEVEEKEAWLAAKKRAEGEKVKDNETLLKKTLKRKEQSKKKSEKAWAERTDGVQMSMKKRQQKREANMQERKDQKKMGKAGKKKGPSLKPKGRPGFEGSITIGRRTRRG